MTRRSDGRWVETLSLPNGKRKYFYGKSKTEVLIKINEFNRQQKSPPLFSELADVWWSSFENTVVYSSMKTYSGVLDRVLESFGDSFVTEINPIDIQLFFLQLRDEGYSRGYITKARTVLSRVFAVEILKKNGTIKTDPTKEARIPSIQKTKIHAATPEQEQTIRDRVHEPFGLFAFFLLYTGCRRQEALAVQWRDVDFDRNTISISKAIGFVEGGRPIVKSTKTENGQRTIPLLSPLRDELLPLRSKDSEYIFGGKRPISINEFLSKWRRYALDAGFMTEHNSRQTSLLTPHQLRHSFATMCLEAELSPEDAQHLLGHASIQTTVNVYADIRETKKQIAAQKLEQFVAKKD